MQRARQHIDLVFETRARKFDAMYPGIEERIESVHPNQNFKFVESVLDQTGAHAKIAGLQGVVYGSSTTSALMSAVGLWVAFLAISHVIAVLLLLYSCWTLFVNRSKSVKSKTDLQTQHGPSKRAFAVFLEWKHLNCWTPSPKKQQILCDCSGTASSGEVLGVMGPSGAGKSTLIEVLMGNRRTYRCEGEILVNDTAATQGIMSSISSVVPQEKPFVPNLSVEETLVFQANLTKACLGNVRMRVHSAIAATGEP